MKNISKYIEDSRFIQWIFNPTPELDEWWKLSDLNNPTEKSHIQQAKNIIQNFKTSDKELPEEEKLMLFLNILKRIEEKDQPKKTLKFATRLMRYAAVAILFFGIGAILFYKKNNFNQQFYSQNLSEPISTNEATLIRPDGENIVLKEKKSTIKYEEDGQIIINDDLVKSSGKDNKEAKLNQLVIPYGKTSEILLSDGSKVYLNAGSRLIYPDNFIDKNREVFLIGEAFFEVKQDENHPFVVQTTDIRIKVLGTRFNVSVYPNEKIIETVLLEGKVRLEENNSGFLSESIDLVPNQLAYFNKVTKEIRTVNVNAQDYVLWTENLFKFESTDFSRVIKKLERYYNIRFLYNDPLIGSIRISGKLDLEEKSEETINRLAVAASVKIIKKGDKTYEISR